MYSYIVFDSTTHTVMVTITPTTPQISPSSTPPSLSLPSITPSPTVPPPPIQQCGVPGSPANGRVNFLTQDVGSIASYSCDNGFSLVGEKFRECQSNLQWSDSVPICTRKFTQLCTCTYLCVRNTIPFDIIICHTTFHSICQWPHLVLHISLLSLTANL